jgi:hypothetical protein
MTSSSWNRSGAARAGRPRAFKLTWILLSATAALSSSKANASDTVVLRRLSTGAVAAIAAAE